MLLFPLRESLLITSVKRKCAVIPEVAAPAAEGQQILWKNCKIKILATLSPTCSMTFPKAHRGLGLVVQVNCKCDEICPN